MIRILTGNLKKPLTNIRLFSTTNATPNSNITLPPVIFVLGGPGSGKGTQCEKFVADMESKIHTSSLISNLHHINVGGLLRAELAKYKKQIQDNIAEEERSKFGSTIDGLISTGQILPSWVTISLLHQELVRIAELKNPETQGKNVVLVDGFPRSVENFTQYETQIQTCSSVIVLDCTPDEMIRRVVSRGLTSGRADDQSTKTIIGRIEIFNTETETVLSNFTPFRHDMNTNIDHVAKIAENRVAIRVDGDPAPNVVSKLFRHAVETLVRRHSME